ncbi:hypothetical protein HDU93_004825 [Gonapodya sp. JEL0774]|nr:hypothetical protein HDU93_004825 [Gonapodya sp. JEL0774]
MTSLIKGTFFSVARLEKVARDVRDKGAECEIAAIDIDNNLSGALEKYLFEFDDRHPVDLVIANAGTTSYDYDLNQDVPSIAWEDAYERILSVNVLGTIRTINPFLKRFAERRSGQIVMTSSINALVGPPNQVFYNASKAAVYSLARGAYFYQRASRRFPSADLIVFTTDLRYVLRPYDVFVSAILPGFIDTRMTEPMKKDSRGASTFPNIMFASPSVVAAGYKAGILRGDFHITSPASQMIQQYVAHSLPSLLLDWYTAAV